MTENQKIELCFWYLPIAIPCMIFAVATILCIPDYLAAKREKDRRNKISDEINELINGLK